jgi:hypothetical protein
MVVSRENMLIAQTGERDRDVDEVRESFPLLTRKPTASPSCPFQSERTGQDEVAGIASPDTFREVAAAENPRFAAT